MIIFVFNEAVKELTAVSFHACVPKRYRADDKDLMTMEALNPLFIH